MMSGQDEELR
jgi:hypothetical protein